MISSVKYAPEWGPEAPLRAICVVLVVTSLGSKAPDNGVPRKPRLFSARIPLITAAKQSDDDAERETSVLRNGPLGWRCGGAVDLDSVTCTRRLPNRPNMHVSDHCGATDALGRP